MILAYHAYQNYRAVVAGLIRDWPNDPRLRHVVIVSGLGQAENCRL